MLELLLDEELFELETALELLPPLLITITPPPLFAGDVELEATELEVDDEF